MKVLINFIKKEAVFTIALLFAVLSALLIPPDTEYINYIDFRTIVLLFSLMAVVAGFKSMGLMEAFAGAIINRVRSTRLLVAVLWGICFFSSMFITNDVALITFVPVAVTVLTLCNKKELIIYTVVLQTVAANMGSMLTPMGNPQNLYIYACFNVGTGEFFSITLPVILLSFLLLMLSTLFVKNEELSIN
ncbi:MAG: SLC13 family permease [Clostridia bacterium]|nr:SLC13 family permease [Clostridia bacterium]